MTLTSITRLGLKPMAANGDGPRPTGLTDVSYWNISLIGLALLALGALLIYLAGVVWPVKYATLPLVLQTTPSATPSAAPLATATSTASPTPIPTPTPIVNGGWDPNVQLFNWKFEVSIELRLLWLVMLFAAIGSYIHVAKSFAEFVGDKKFERSWIWWYVLQTPVGIALALTFYVGIRGGILPATSSNDVNPFGIAFFAGLVGLFSKQATDKLGEVFDTLFRSSKTAERPPVITSVAPNEGLLAENKPVVIRGSNLSGASAVRFGSTQAQFKVDRDDQVTATSPLADKPGTVHITVQTAAGTSAQTETDKYVYLEPK
jgi:hypothetical protein